MRRGDIVVVSAPGDYGKPRPAVVVQSDYLSEAGLDSVIVCLMTSHVEDAPAFRLTVEPDSDNGLVVPSQVMVDKLLAVRMSRIGRVVGRLNDETVLRLNRTLAFAVGLAE